MGGFDLPAFAGFPALASHPWAYPALEAAHIVGIALLVGNLVLLEARVWGVAAELPVRPLARLSLRLALGGFAIVAVTGLAMFSSQPGDLLANRAFVVKMGLVALAGMALLYLCLALIQARAQALSTWRRWSYAGFYLDEFVTRATLRLWPARWTPAATE